MSVKISFQTDDKIKSLIDAFAVKKHLTKNKVINDALSAYLQSIDNKITNQVNLLRAIDCDDDY